MNIGIITARGGSKRIPKKNIKHFCGKPIIAYSIEAALEANIFDEVMVSTDSGEIAEIAREYGASVPFMRSEKTSNDYAVTADVIEEVLDNYKKRGVVADTFCCMYPTAPFITSNKLVDAMEQFARSDAQSLAVVAAYSFPPQRAFGIRDSWLQYLYPEHERTRSQDLETIYHDCGQFYICDAFQFRKYHSLVMPKTLPFVMSEEEVQDIDTETDWKLAEIKYQLMQEGQSQCACMKK